MAAATAKKIVAPTNAHRFDLSFIPGKIENFFEGKIKPVAYNICLRYETQAI